MQERREGSPRLVEIRTIGVEIATQLLEKGVETAKEMGVSGFLVVCDRMGMQKCSQATSDEVTTTGVAIALDKIKTVLANRRSTSIQRDGMRVKGQSREDFAGQLGSLFGGGVAIFADWEHTQFVGAIAFSGGTEEQDEKICKKALEKVGLHSDLPQDTKA